MTASILIAINQLQIYVTLEIIIQAWIKYYPGIIIMLVLYKIMFNYRKSEWLPLFKNFSEIVIEFKL